MARLGPLRIDSDRESTLPGKVTETIRQVNDRFLRIQDVMDANEGAAVHWTETSLPTAAVRFAGRFLYHDRGQGATPDNLYVCLWNGSAWTWVLIV